MDGEIDGDASSHTTSRMNDRRANVQIVERVSGRRIWTGEQKLAIIGEAFSPGSSVCKMTMGYRFWRFIVGRWKPMSRPTVL